MIIPPMKLSAALAYIDTFYGLYEKGSLIYFGVEAGYILKYDGPCTAYHYNENQTTSILVPKPSGELSDNPGVLLKQNQSQIEQTKQKEQKGRTTFILRNYKKATKKLFLANFACNQTQDK